MSYACGHIAITARVLCIALGDALREALGDLRDVLGEALGDDERMHSDKATETLKEAPCLQMCTKTKTESCHILVHFGSFSGTTSCKF